MMRMLGEAVGYVVAFLLITVGLGVAQVRPPEQHSAAAQKAYAEAREFRKRGDHKAELEALNRACSAGAIEACHDLGVVLEDGEVVPQNYHRAAELYRQACDHELAVSCFNLALMYERGQGASQNLKEAIRLQLKSCDLKLPRACNEAAYLYLNGIGVPADPAAATRLFWRACRLDYWMSCDNLSNAYFKGAGVATDLGRALRLKVRACRGHFQSACESLNTVLAKLSGARAQTFPLRQALDETEQLDQQELDVRLAAAAGDFDQAHRRLQQTLERLSRHNALGSEHVVHFVLLRSQIYEQQGPVRYARRTLEDHLERIDRLGVPAQNISMVKLLVRLSDFDEQARDMARARENWAAQSISRWHWGLVI